MDSAGRGQFTSKIGFILATAGSAIGLGNLSAFPVGAAKNGGAAFLIIYLLFVAFICLPVMIAELSMGRSSRKNPVGAFGDISNQSRFWKGMSYLAVITPFMIAVFYLVITVWVFTYFVEIVGGNLGEMAKETYFGSFCASPKVFFYTLIVLGMIVGILFGGVSKGIERANKIMMPALAFMLIALVVFALTLENAMKGVSFYLLPDFSRINGKVINAALSQAFFSLSLGMGILITYGSYLKKQDDIIGSAKLVAVADTAIAFFAGLLILPSIFSFNPSIDAQALSESSVGLIFIFLPKVFMSMANAITYGGASIVAALFFLLVYFAALTSMISIVEVPVSYLVDEKGFGRKKALITISALLIVFSSVAATSFGMSDFFSNMVTYGGGSKSFFDIIADLFYATILPFVGFLVCVFCAYRWKMSQMFREIDNANVPLRVLAVDAEEERAVNASASSSFLKKYIQFSLGTFIPVLLFFIFINTVLSVYFNIDLIGRLFG